MHFVGLDNPGKWFSTELGAACFDEAHEIDEKSVLTINSRLRQRCRECIAGAVPDDDCSHMPHRILITFNPSYPGHWLQQWFILGAQRTEFGFRKEELIATEADFPIGDAEFFISRATERSHLFQALHRKGTYPGSRRWNGDGIWTGCGSMSAGTRSSTATRWLGRRRTRWI